MDGTWAGKLENCSQVNPMVFMSNKEARLEAGGCHERAKNVTGRLFEVALSPV